MSYGKEKPHRNYTRVVLALVSLIEKRARILAVHTLSRSTKDVDTPVGDATTSQFDMLVSMLNSSYGYESFKEERYYDNLVDFKEHL